jgi:hypothetical protein
LTACSTIRAASTSQLASSYGLTWELQPGVETIRAHLSEQSADYLPLDDEAWAVVEGGTSNRVLLVSRQYLPRASLRHPPRRRAISGQPGAPLDPAFDLYVFDGAPLPDQSRTRRSSIVNPPPAQR